MDFVTQVGAFTGLSADIINRNFAMLSGLTLGQGTAFFLDPSLGNDAYNGLAPTAQSDGVTGPKRSLPGAYNAAAASHNDTVVLLANGATSATARIDSAFTWAKSETHFVGICSPVLLSQRSRMAPSTTTTAFANFFTISGSGCAFADLQWFDGFTTGTTAQICLTITTGSRNSFQRCHIAGMGDTTSAADAGSRSLKIGSNGSGENLFEDCTIGVDTITRSAANASVEFAGATPRNTFRRCHFPFMTSSATVLGILGTGNGCVDRYNIFESCRFINATKSTSTGMTALLSFTTASPGGMIIFTDCAMVGVTKFGDTNGLANSFLDMAAVSASAGGLMLAPT